MPNRQILHMGNPLLAQKSTVVNKESFDEISSLVQDLDDTLATFRHANGFGRGIAAPQIGVLKRVIFVRIPGGFSGALINPEITWKHDRHIELWDACFSLPNLMVKVTRSPKVTVEYTDIDGVRQTLEAHDDLAELLQHEIDHLDGILMTERAVDNKSFSFRDEWERFHSE